jgi:hypothetical protein
MFVQNRKSTRMNANLKFCKPFCIACISFCFAKTKKLRIARICLSVFLRTFDIVFDFAYICYETTWMHRMQKNYLACLQFQLTLYAYHPTLQKQKNLRIAINNVLRTKCLLLQI